jgi:MFS family permease
MWPLFYQNHLDSLRYSFGNIFICNKSWIITLMKSMVYIGCFFGNVVYSFLPDNYGRKFAYIITWTTTCIGLIILASSWNIIGAGIGLFLIGLGMDQTQAVTFMIIY